MPVTNGDARLGIGVPDLAAAQRYYDSSCPSWASGRTGR
jgi:hypothetical protein